MVAGHLCAALFNETHPTVSLGISRILADVVRASPAFEKRAGASVKTFTDDQALSLGATDLTLFKSEAEGILTNQAFLEVCPRLIFLPSVFHDEGVKVLTCLSPPHTRNHRTFSAFLRQSFSKFLGPQTSQASLHCHQRLSPLQAIFPPYEQQQHSVRLQGSLAGPSHPEARSNMPATFVCSPPQRLPLRYGLSYLLSYYF